jgi:site-specific recombinase XerD
VPLPDDLAEELLNYDGYIFSGQIDGHLSAAYVSKLMSRELDGATGHQLRHRYATRAYQLGGNDIRAVQELLGHASVATTQIYTAVQPESLRRTALAAA